MRIERDNPINFFYVSSGKRKDEYLRSELEKHLITLQPLVHWHPQLILPGGNVTQVIDYHLKTSHLILLLVSPDFLVSEQCKKITEKVMEYWRKGEIYVVPILLRPANYESSPFAHLSLLPSDGRPITSWPKPENALFDVAKGLSKVIKELQTRPSIISSLKPLWSVPYERNMFFTGREIILSYLAHALRPGQTPNQVLPQAISGLGGVGKTQTALEYVYRNQDEYQAIFWIRADSQEMLQTDLLAMAQALNISQTEVQSSMISAVQRWLHDHNNWLLVFDNVEDIDIIKSFLPNQRTGYVLLTTQAKAMGSIAHRVDLEQMTVEEGSNFLLRRATINSKESYWVEVVVQAMDGLPLALDQAGAFIEETQCTFEAYYHLFQQKKVDLLRRRGYSKDGTHPDPISTTWSLSFSKIQQFNSSAIGFLSLCAFLDPDSIPEDIFTIGAGKVASLSDMQDPLIFHETIAVLLSYSLIHRNPDRTLTLHRLLQDVLRQHIGLEKQSYWAACSVRLVNHVFPKNLYEEWDLCRIYLPHALVCTTYIEKFQLNFLEAAELLYKVGITLYSYARYKEIETLYLRAQAIAEDILGTEHPFTATILKELANLYYVESQHGKAEKFFKLALAIREKVLGLEHLDTADSLNDLAQLCYSHAQYGEAEVLYQRSLAIREKILGADDVVTADSLHHLGILYHAQERYEEAELLYQRALAIQEQVLGPEHPETLDSLDCLARLHHDRGQYTDLEPLYQRILATRKTILGPEHPYTAISMDNLAWLYRDQKRYEEAEALHKESWEIRKKRLHPQHPNIAISLDSLATIYRIQGNYQLAEKFYNGALGIREKSKGLDHPYTIQSFHALTSLYYDQGQYEQAVLLYQQGLTDRKEKLGADHPHIAKFLQDYIDFLRMLKRFEDANYLETNR